MILKGVVRAGSCDGLVGQPQRDLLDFGSLEVHASLASSYASACGLGRGELSTVMSGFRPTS